jgi:hypothetical protein
MSKGSAARDALTLWIFEREAATFAAHITPWLDAAPRFATFLRTYQDKIRRKARLCGDADARLDLLAELAVAWTLVQDGRFAVEYERAQPDFTATWKTHTTLHAEAKRLRTAESSNGTSLAKWNYAVCDKLRQLPPDGYNLVALVVDDAAAGDDLAAAMKQLKLHAERKDEAYFGKRGLTVAEFFARYGRLHAIAVCGIDAPLPRVRALWLNKEARRPLPPDVLRALNAMVAPR